MKIYVGIVVFGLAIAACTSNSGDSGVDKSKKINALSKSDVQTFCQWALTEQGGAGHQTMCSGGLTVTTQAEVECESSYGNFTATCTATISDAEGCIHALVTDPCSLGGNACQPVIACSLGLTPAAQGSAP